MQHIKAPVSNSANRGVTTTLALSMLLGSLGTSIANIALPVFVETFSAPFHHVQWVVIAYLAALTVSVILAGRLGDIYGLRRMHLFGLGLFLLASLLCGIAPNLWLLIGARALQGVGAAFLMSLTLALMRETAQETRIGQAMGLLGTVSALGTAIGPSLGGMILSATDWRGIFLVQIPLALLTLILAFVSLPRDAGKDRMRPTGVRTVMTPGLASSLVVNALVAAVMMTTLVVGPFYLGLGLGLKQAIVGLVMAAGPAISVFSGVPSGRAVDAWGAQRVLAAGLSMLAGGAFLLSVLPEMFGVTGYILAMVVLTPGYQLFQAANNTAVLSGTPNNRRGTASGLPSLSRNIGLVAGASAMGAVFAFGVGTADLASASRSAIASGMRLTFILATLLMVATLWMTLGRRTRTEPS
ncbi:MFS transporter [Nitratireductor sp. CAU 1489]|uniref:MFS transporter n=1 Tax=Nitratireductor arenosus TaxID=2682096 RepID=A0A844QLR5_9HYPH|nr:MFS transporter [Nitratireductor arenosus]MVA98569.1 MFS transporter [Nitratireductor arenosus]